MVNGRSDLLTLSDACRRCPYPPSLVRRAHTVPMHPTGPPPHCGRRRGQALVELALMLLLIAVVLLATLVLTGQHVREVFAHDSCALSSGSYAPTAGTGGGGAGLSAAPTPPVDTGSGGRGGGGF